MSWIKNFSAKRQFKPSSFGGRYELLEIMEDSWKKIYSQYYIDGREVGGNINDESLVLVMAETVVRGVKCG